MEDYNKSEILKEALHRLNMKNTDLAALTGKHYMTVSKWITGKAKVPEYVFLSILDYENKRYNQITGKLATMPESMRERLEVATGNISGDNR
jgi:hypothetical protein